jgi:hypothetical protein
VINVLASVVSHSRDICSDTVFSFLISHNSNASCILSDSFGLN